MELLAGRAWVLSNDLEQLVPYDVGSGRPAGRGIDVGAPPIQVAVGAGLLVDRHRALVRVDPTKLHDLHLLISSVSRPEHLTLFERGIARKIDFAYAGPESVRLAQLLEDGKLEIGAIHTYVELYARMFVDLMPDVALICAEQADRQGNLYTGPNTEDTPTIVEATAFHDGVVVVQVNQVVDELPRVDIPASWIDVIVAAERPYEVEPLFTRDPRLISEVQILLGMLVIRGIYERHGVTTLNHGIGFDTAAIELLLPTYGEKLGLRGKRAFLPALPAVRGDDGAQSTDLPRRPDGGAAAGHGHHAADRKVH